MSADLVLFTATANTSIVTLNLSLMLNKVGFYQVCAALTFIMLLIKMPDALSCDAWEHARRLRHWAAIPATHQT